MTDRRLLIHVTQRERDRGSRQFSNGGGWSREGYINDRDLGYCNYYSFAPLTMTIEPPLLHAPCPLPHSLSSSSSITDFADELPHFASEEEDFAKFGWLLDCGQAFCEPHLEMTVPDILASESEDERGLRGGRVWERMKETSTETDRFRETVTV